MKNDISRPHNPKVIGSNPIPATNFLPFKIQYIQDKMTMTQSCFFTIFFKKVPQKCHGQQNSTEIHRTLLARNRKKIGHFFNVVSNQVGIVHGGSDVLMSENLLDCSKVNICRNKQSSGRMAEIVKANWLSSP